MTLNTLEIVNVEVSPKPVKSKPPKYGIHVLSEEAKVIKPAPKRSKQNLQTELTKCQMLNHRLHLENYQYWKVAQAVYGIFQQMGQEINAKINVICTFKLLKHVSEVFKMS